MCLRSGVVEVAEVVDHVVPHKGDEELFFDRDNLQPLCKAHHDGAKQRIERGQEVVTFDERGWPI
ncbi:HNH endonuclease [Xanthobacteraceae bacterium A53D]